MAKDSPDPDSVYSVLEAAARLDWTPSRLRYWESRFRSELGCVRTPGGDPVFSSRQLLLLEQAVRWIEAEHADEEAVRGRIGALMAVDPAHTVQPQRLPSAPITSTPPPHASAAAVGSEWGEVLHHLEGISRGMNGLRDDIHNLESLLGQLLTALSQAGALDAAPTPSPAIVAGQADMPADSGDDRPVAGQDRSTTAGPAVLIKRGQISVWSLPRWQPSPLPPASAAPSASAPCRGESPLTRARPPAAPD